MLWGKRGRDGRKADLGNPGTAIVTFPQDPKGPQPNRLSLKGTRGCEKPLAWCFLEICAWESVVNQEKNMLKQMEVSK